MEKYSKWSDAAGICPFVPARSKPWRGFKALAYALVAPIAAARMATFTISLVAFAILNLANSLVLISVGAALLSRAYFSAPESKFNMRGVPGATVLILGLPPVLGLMRRIILQIW
jgi:hypothetical protein